jgi:ATPase subunit of ABC transporter with duplicated ATPase domains
MSAVAPGWKLRVLLAQALFGDPDILLLDEPTNNLDINTIRWLEGVLNERNSTMVIISHDRHFLNSVCTHMADLDYGELRAVPRQLRRVHDRRHAGARAAGDNAKKKAQIAELQSFVSRFSANASKAKQATSRARQIEKIELDRDQALEPPEPLHPLRPEQEAASPGGELRDVGKGYGGRRCSANFSIQVEAGERVAIIGPNGAARPRCCAA